VPVTFGRVSQLYADLQAQKPVECPFDEVECGKPTSSLGRFAGIELIPLLKRYRDSLDAPPSQ